MPSDCVLVSGCAGFIGSHLCERLVAEGIEVVGIDNFCDFYDPRIKRKNLNALLSKPLFTLVEADIRDRKKIEAVFAEFAPKVVIHLAAMPGVRPSIENPELYVDVNVSGTTVLLDASSKHGVEHFVFGSSSSVYGNNDKVPFSEHDRVETPISPYAATKRSGELLCYTFHSLYGFACTVLRFFTVFGPRQRPDLAIQKFLGAVLKDETITLFGDGTMSRDYTYIDDIVDGVVASLEKPRGFRIYNLGGSNPVTLLELVEVIRRVTMREVRVRFAPKQKGDVERTFADITLASKELGFAPKMSLEEGIRRQWQYLLEEG
jgi:UDP-glucuronate 4-epimerase